MNKKERKQLIELLNKIIAIESRYPNSKVELPYTLKNKVSDLAAEFKQHGRQHVGAILQDTVLRDLLIKSFCYRRTYGYDYKKIDFWTSFAGFAERFQGLNILLQESDGVMYLSIQNAEMLFEENLMSRNILFVGERDFSFTHVFAITHPRISSSIITTTKESFDTLLGLWLLNSFPYKPIIELLQHGVVFAFSVDATNLETYSFAAPGKFRRIQFNCPFADDEEKASLNKPKTQKLVQQFLKSARPLLEPRSGQLHVSIQQPEKEPEQPAGIWSRRQYQESFGLTPKSIGSNGLIFFKTLKDIEKRYQDKVRTIVRAPVIQDEEDENKADETPVYKPYVGKSPISRINQFIFKPVLPIPKAPYHDFSDYDSDLGDSDEELHEGVVLT